MISEPESGVSSTARSGPATSVFVSYSRQDFYFTEQVLALLSRHGIRAWVDLAELGPGDDWAQRIEQALRQAGGVVLLATRASVASPYVIDECQRAVACGLPVYVVLGQSCKLPAFLRAMTRYDARGRLPEAIGALAADLAEPGAQTRAAAVSLRRRWTSVAFVQAVLIATTLTCTAIALSFLLAMFTPFEKVTLAANSSLVAISARDFLVLQTVTFAAGAGVGASCAWAITHRRWRFGFLLWLFCAQVGLLSTGLSLLPWVGADIRLDGGTGSGGLSSALHALARVSVATSVLGCLALLVLAGSRAVLRRSQTGAGSPVARARLYRGDPGYWSSAFGNLFSSVGIGEIDELRQFQVVADADQELTFRIDADPADRRLAATLDSACQVAGMSRGGDQADRRLLLLTNANTASRQTVQEALSRRADLPIVVFGSSLRLDLDDPLVRRYQWIDFRRRALDPVIAARLAGRAALDTLPMTPPVSLRQFRAPAMVSLTTLALKVDILYFALIVVSEAFRGLPGGVIGVIRTALALTMAIGLGMAHRLIVRRQSRQAAITLLRRALLGVCVLFGILSLLAPNVEPQSRVFSALMGFLYPVGLVLLLGSQDKLTGWLGDWLPAADAPLPAQPAARSPLALRLPLIFIAIWVGCVLVRYLPL